MAALTDTLIPADLVPAVDLPPALRAVGDPAAGGTVPVDENADSVVDPFRGPTLRELFVCSGLVDVVRDVAAAHVAAGRPVTVQTVDQLIAQYMALRDMVAALLGPADIVGLTVAAPSLTAGCSVEQLHAASSTLARYLDVLHEAPHFVAKSQMLTAAADEAVRGLSAATSPAQPEVRAGTYL